MLFITHNLGIVRRIADRVAVMQDGRDRRDRPDRARSSPRPEHPYTRMLLAAEPTGRPDPVPAGRPDRRRDRPPPRLVPDQPRPPAQDRRPRQGGQRRHRRHPRRRDPRRRRRVRLRQDHARPRDHAADRVRGPHRLPRPGHPGLEEPRAPRACAATCRWCSRTPTARSPRACRSSRSSPRASPCTASATRRAASPRSSSEVGLDPATMRPLPARVLRRPAPAHRHRPRDDPAAEARRARRADHRPRHDRAGADRRAPAPAAGEVRPRLRLHLATTSASSARSPTRSW